METILIRELFFFLTILLWNKRTSFSDRRKVLMSIANWRLGLQRSQGNAEGYSGSA